MADYLLQEDGTSKFILEDSSGDILLESSPAEIDPSFIASVTTVYTPTVAALSVLAPFIASVSAVYTPAVTGPAAVTGPFDPISEDFLSNPAEFENGLGQGYDDFTLDDLTTGTGFPFIASRTVVYSFPLPEVTAPFIASAAAVYAPSLNLTGTFAFTAAGTYSWLCPPDVTFVSIEAWGGGGGGGTVGGNSDGGGGGGGAYAKKDLIPVTPGTVYTVIVGAGGTTISGATANAGGDSSFTGDGGNEILAKGGGGGPITGGGHSAAGGQASSSIGDVTHSGGAGGATVGGPGESGDGGGAGAGRTADGASGSSGTGGGPTTGGGGGAGVNGGGSGGQGGGYNTGNAQPGSAPGGGGGGAGGSATGASGADGRINLDCGVLMDFIGSATAVYAPSLPAAQLTAPFIPSVTVVFAPSLPEIQVPFIGPTGRVYGVFSTFDPAKTFSGPGNGGEIFLIRLNANGVTDTATLAADIGPSDTALSLTGDGSFPTSVPFVVAIDSEILYVVQIAAGSYRIRARAMSNTTAASHTAGATVSWGDSYDMALIAGANIDASFSADILSTGTETYYGWLICFDSSQAYLGGSRYPMHVGEVVGVFDAGAGTTGSNRLDAAQPNAVCTPVGVSDDCPAALSNPALITSNITTGDVAVVRYTNPESSVLDLGPRSTALQSWFGLKRVSSTDTDVTLTDPTGYVVDTIPSGGGPGPFTGSVNQEWGEPIPLATGIAPDASDVAGTPIDTPNPVPWTTVTLPGADRYFTDGIHYSEKGWPMCCVSVRQGNRRVPHWQSWDWHDYGYVYTGFGPDDTFAQILINRNGVVFDSVPSVELPGSQDIDGPDAVWDDASYYVGASWYVVLFNTPYIVFGPSIGGSPSQEEGGGPLNGFAPGVTFPPGGAIIATPVVEGGAGGGIDGQPATSSLFQAASV